MSALLIIDIFSFVANLCNTCLINVHFIILRPEENVGGTNARIGGDAKTIRSFGKGKVRNEWWGGKLFLKSAIFWKFTAKTTIEK